MANLKIRKIFLLMIKCKDKAERLEKNFKIKSWTKYDFTNRLQVSMLNKNCKKRKHGENSFILNKN